MTAQTPIAPDFSRQSGPFYKGRIDAAAALHRPVAGAFAAFASVQFDFVPGDVSAASDTVSQAEHGLFDDDVVRFSTTGALPAPLEGDTDYHVVAAAAGAFKVAATQGGDPLDLDDAGSGIHTCELTEGLKVRVTAGKIRNGVALTSVAAQITAALTAPTGDPRHDIVYVDARTGALGVAAGSENASPADPAIPAGKIAVARLVWAVDQAEIVNADLTDLRAAPLPFDIAALEEAEADPADDHIVFLDATDGALKKALLPPSKDQTARDLAVVAIMGAYSTGGVRGTHASFIADSDHFSTKTNATFATDHYVNLGGAAQISQGAGTPIGNMSNAGGLAAAYDGEIDNQANSSLSSNSNSASFSGYNNTNGKDWGSGVTKTVVKVVLKAPTDVQGFGLYASMTWKLQGSANGSDWTDLYTASALPANTTSATVTVDSGIDVATAYRYHRINVNGDGINYIGFAEIEFSEPSDPPDMTLADDALTLAAADPDTVDVYVLEKAVDASPTRRVRVSIDGGSTWSGPGTLEDSFVYEDKLLYRYSADTSGLTGASDPGDELAVEYNTLDDGKEREFHGMWAVPLYP